MCCMALIVFGVSGCGSDNSDEAKISNEPPQAVPGEWFNTGNFIQQYNAAIDQIAAQDGQNYDAVKIIGVDQFREPRLNFNRNDMYHMESNAAFNYLDATEDKDVSSIGFMCFFDYLPEPYAYAVLYASVSAFPQFKDLDFNAMRKLVLLNEGPFIEVEKNGLLLRVERNNALEFSISNVEMVRREQRRKIEEEAAENERQRKEKEERKRAETERQRKLYSAYSLGGLNLGGNVSDIHNVFGIEKEIRPSQTMPGSSFYEYNDVVITVNGGTVTGIASYTNAVQTEKGIRQGDPLSKVFSAYGNVCALTDYDDQTLYEYPFELGGGKFVIMRFAVKNDAVDYISLRTVDRNEFKKIYSARRTV